MKTLRLPIRLLLTGTATAFLSGCLDLKPVSNSSRYFVLSALPEAAATAPQTSSVPPLAVGVGQVKLPAYLFRDGLAIRKGTNEVEYLENALWAERLDSGFLRVFAADLAARVPTDRVRLSAWRSQEVALEVYVTVQEFDVDTTGRAVLAAWWRILSPGGDKILKAGQFHAVRQGPRAQSNPQGAAAALSELLAELSGDLAQSIRSVAPQKQGRT